MKSQLVKWGNSLAVRIPQALVRDARMSERESLEIAVQDTGVIMIRKAEPKLTLDELLDGITRDNLHHEAHWVRAVGKEIW